MEKPTPPEGVAIPTFKPMTKDDVASIFGVSCRTVENWIEQEGLPAPVSIGNRVYWHPHLFYCWLDERLRQPTAKVHSPTASSKAKGAANKTADIEGLLALKQKRISAIASAGQPD